MENINKTSATTTVTEPQNESLYPNKAGFKPEKSVTIGGVILCNRDIEYNASRPTNKITIRNSSGKVHNRYFVELQRIRNALLSTPMIRVEDILNGSGSSRNQPETIFANLP